MSNCTLSGNSAIRGTYSEGGGAFNSTLNNCTLTGNSASDGGGAYGAELHDVLLALGERANAFACCVGRDHEDAVVPLPTRQAVIVEEL